jgi:hypothetical protein
VNFQTIGAYLDVLFFLVLGALAISIPDRLVGTSGSDEERRRKLKVVKISGWLWLRGSPSGQQRTIEWVAARYP